MAGDPDAQTLEDTIRDYLHEHVARVERLVAVRRPPHAVSTHQYPAWLRATDGEGRWAVTAAVAVAIGLQLCVPARLTIRPAWLLPLIESALLAALAVANPRRIMGEHWLVRAGRLALVGVASLANTASAGRLVLELVRGRGGQEAGPLLAVGAAIWLTNVIIFGCWYWEFDRGGPVARALGRRPHPDFLFPQMQSPELAHDFWEPAFPDYLYLAFANATAFSPDAQPLSRWAKMTVLVQSSVSLVTVAMVISRAVGLLK